MIPHELTIAIRNLLLVQFVMIALVPEHAVLFCRKLIRMRRTINSLFRQKRRALAKGRRFWEIDFTRFEP